MVLQLVQTTHCGNDEYYIQSMDNGQYLNGNSMYFDFQDYQSAATLFRFKKYQRPLEGWRRRLGVSSHVLYKKQYRRNSIRAAGEVIATKDGEFGREIMVQYKGFSWTHWCNGIYNILPKVERVSGEDWIPIESDLISIENLGVVKRYNVQKGYGFIACDDGSGDLFVHFSEIKWREFQILREGERVAFDVVIQEDGRRKAINVMMSEGYGMGEYRRDLDRVYSRLASGKLQLSLLEF